MSRRRIGATSAEHDHHRTLIRAAMVVDADRVHAAPGVLYVDGETILAAGEPARIGTPPDVEIVERPDLVLMPALVNAHCHLDLTCLGPRPYQDDFPAWLDGIRRGRPGDAESIRASTAAGVELARAGGTALVGDIAGAGSSIPAEVMRTEGLGGVSFLEVFGLGANEPRAIDAMHRVADLPRHARGVKQGVQPHAPYSCGAAVYRAAAALDRPLSTHLAESPEELRFLTDGDGPVAEMLRGFGVWDEGRPAVGAHPIDAVLDWLDGAPALLAHVNYLDSSHMQRLARAGVVVAYCPRASAYFGHPRGVDRRMPAGHRYRELVDAGVDVALGTDSLVCLDTPDRISVLDEMRLLARRDDTAPLHLLEMATRAGARGLGVDEALVTLAPGPTAGVIGVPVAPESHHSRDPLGQALTNTHAPEWIVGPIHGARLMADDARSRTPA